MTTTETSNRRVKQGVVLSNKMAKTVVVNVARSMRHPKYEKIVTVNKKYYAHCEDPNVKVGDTVRIQESRPLSRLKRWVVVGT